MLSKKILVIDDDIDLVEAMRITLESAGFDVVDAQSGQQGIKRLQNDDPDLIILDVMMQTQDEGFHTAYEIRSMKDYKDIPIIMLTAITMETGFTFDRDKDGDFLPVDEFLEKPISPQVLLEKVKIHLGL
ncbi:MAG: response regulator [Candidatus Marinimicrobia bacterium]|nr:response regulator [Candidatus Neomarinimicrobiota bacterium]